jgi:hypothetical protein
MILSFAIQFNSLEEFLDHWSARYPERNFGDRDKYDPFVGKRLTEPSRLHLFEWKNGSKISKAKSASVSKNYPLSFPKSELEERYLNPQRSGGAIWNIFYMHCIDPVTWPIFDQHTYRAMHFMKTGDLKEIPFAKAKVYKSYKEEYIPFVTNLNSDQRRIDKALFAFGQFLKLARPYR